MLYPIRNAQVACSVFCFLLAHRFAIFVLGKRVYEDILAAGKRNRNAGT